MNNANMKNALYALLAIILVGSVAGCDAFQTLDNSPENSVPADGALTDEQGAQSTLLGLYDETQGFMDDYTIFAALASDQASHTGSFPSWSAIDNYTMAAGSPEAEGQWNGIYDAINVANLLIAQAQASELDNLDESEAAAIRAQARAIRAFCYHGLVRWFGGQGALSDAGVPLVLEPTENIDEVTFPSRSTVGEVYGQILADLNQAESLMEGNANEPTDAGFVDNVVIDGLQARAYLYQASIKRRATGSAQGDYQAARDNAQEVLAVNDGLSRLNGIYSSLNSAESIWELQYNSTDGNAMSFFARPSGEGGREEYNLDANRSDQFKADSLDNRLSVNIKEAGGTEFIGKYFRLDGSDHHFILRVSEVKLILAEALTFLDLSSNQSTIAKQVNDIRRRSYNEINDGDPDVFDFEEAGAEVNPDSLTSQSEALSVILEERRDELAFEGHRWHDLNRLGLAEEVLSLPASTDRRWPIPQEELDVNENLSQNPGY